MNLGSKVRTKHGDEEGIVVKILPNNLVEIEIEDGFTIPVLASDLVIVAQEEASNFEAPVQNNNPTPVIQRQAKALTGIFLAAYQEQNAIFVELINNTDIDLFFIVLEKNDSNTSNTISGVLRAKSTQHITQWSAQKSLKWPSLMIQGLKHHKDQSQLFPVIDSQVHLTADQVKSNKTVLPLKQEKGFLYPLDHKLQQEPAQTAQKDKSPSIDKQELANKMMEKGASMVRDYENKGQLKSTEIDLHIEAIHPQADTLPKDEILKTQLNFFEQKLDEAISSNMDEITFIHGVGNGVLRMEIHRILSRHGQISFFKDASKTKFGYGATYVKL